jgi:bifunctional aspartokinase / homoserine dehydrogenase 1
MKVLKFGGSSVGSPGNIKLVTQIIGDYINKGEKLAVVTSAMMGVTNDLVKVGNMAAVDNENYKELSDQIISRHIEAIKTLIHIKAQSSIIAQLKFLTNNLEDLLHGVFLLKELSPRTLDLVLSFGERFASMIIAAYLNQLGIPTEWLDMRQLIKTNDNFGNAKVIENASFDNIRRYFEFTRNYRLLQDLSDRL